MFTKAQAIALRQQFILALGERIDAAIQAAVLQGGQSAVVSFAPANNAQATNVMNTYIANGWTTSAIDLINKTITIAP